MKVPYLDLNKQYNSIKKEIDIAISSVINDNAFINGKYVHNFEINFAKAHYVNNCLGVGNGTDALVIALKALGLTNGDEVITVPNTFIATAEAITQVGCKPVFIDCEPEGYCLDTSLIEKNITKNTKAIIPVHLFGHAADMDKINTIAEKYGLFVIEDAAQAALAEYKDKKIGGLGHIATFSFYPGKNLGAYGDAGAIISNNKALYDFAKMYANHGRIGKYDHEFEGINSRMDGIQGAVLDVKLKHLQKWTDDRRKIANIYNDNLSSIQELILPKEMDYAKHVYHIYAIRSSRRDELLEYLKKNDIGVGIHYPIALHELKAYKYLGYKPNDFPNAHSFSKELLSLPIYPEMDEKQIDYVIESIKSFFK